MEKILKSLAQIEKELESDPDNAKLWNERGVGYHLLGKFEEAIQSFSRSLDLNTSSASTHFNLGNTLQETEQFEAAISHFHSALELKPDHIPSLTHLADAWEQTGEPGKAEELFRYLCKINPDDPLSHHNLGNFLLRQNRHIQAADCYETVIRLDPTFSDAYITIAWILEQVGALKEAASYLQKGLQAAPGDEDLQQALARLGP